MRCGRQPKIDLDHIGLGVERVDSVLRDAVDRLGATVIWGGDISGCRYVTTRVGDHSAGMDLEFLEPKADDDPFLRRFLDRAGPGPHHLTFVTRDLDGTLARFQAAGILPIVARLDDPLWREAFFGANAMGGIVVQLAETEGLRSDAGFARARRDEWRGPGTTERRGWRPGESGWWSWPGWRGPRTAFLVRVVLAGADLGLAHELYGELLEGMVVERTAAALELEWPRGGRLRFEAGPRGSQGGVRLELVGGPGDLVHLGGVPLTPALS